MSPILFLHDVWDKWSEQAQSPQQRLVADLLPKEILKPPPVALPLRRRRYRFRSWHSGAPRLLSCSCTMCGTSGASKHSHHSNAGCWLYIRCRCWFLPRVSCVMALLRRFRSWLCLGRLRMAIRAGRGHLPDRAVLRGFYPHTVFRHSGHSGAPCLLSCSCTMCGTSGVSKRSHHSNAWSRSPVHYLGDVGEGCCLLG